MLSALAVVLPVSNAFASGPGGGAGTGSGANGRVQVNLVCGGQPLTFAITNLHNSNGAGQLVDASGHGIAAFGTFLVTDITAGVVLFGGPINNGNGHSNQKVTECTGITFISTVADLRATPPGGLPAGVLPTDTAVGTVDAFVVLKVPS
jgi:hypothetical protein